MTIGEAFETWWETDMEEELLVFGLSADTARVVKTVALRAYGQGGLAASERASRIVAEVMGRTE